MNHIGFLVNKTCHRLVKLALAGAVIAAATVAQAGLLGPYPVDGNTLHLWHFDETNGSLCFDSVSNNPQSVAMTVSNTPGINAFSPATDAYFAAIAQSAAFPSYGSSIMTTQYSCFYSPWYATNGQAYPSPAYTNIANYANTNTGAFTMEALVKPSVSLLSSTPVSNPEILGGDNGGNITTPPVARGWQWRFDCGAPSAGAAELEFNDINCPGTNHQLIARLPITGPDAVVLGNWYHVAVAYTGGAPTNGDPPHVLTMYWTLVDPTRTNGTADVLTNYTLAFTYTNANSAGMLNWSANALTTGLYPSNTLHGTPFFVVGGNGRNNLSNDVASASGFDGLIDEVRISDVYRHANEFLFTTNPVDQKPIITVQPAASTFLAYGQTLTLSPTVTGTQPIQYQWTQNGAILPSQTNEFLVISNITLAAAGNYQCFATNTTVTFGTAGTNSAVVVVTVGAGFQNLFNTGVDANGNPLDQSAPGSVDMHYTLIENPDTNTVFPQAIIWGDQVPVQPNGVLPPNGAAVWIGPEENAGSVVGTYEYQTTFQIDESIVTNSVLSGNLVASGPAAGGIVQAFVNGVETDIPLSAANPSEFSSSFSISNGLQAGSNVLQFVVACIGGGGGAIGLHVQISGLGPVLPPGAPTVNSQPTSQTVAYGGTAGLAVVALGQPPLSYQWLSNGVALSSSAIPSAASSYLTFAATNFSRSLLDTNGNFNVNYQVIISNNSGSTTSSVATVTIADIAPQVTQIPTTGTNTMLLYAGANPTFSVLPVGGVAPDYYQWFSNGVVVTTVTNTAYAITNVQIGALSAIECTVSNVAAVTPNLWAISVIADPSAPFPKAVLAAKPLGYWRLNESDDNLSDGNPGALCNDYAGGHDGIYTNTALGQGGYNSTTDPNETAAYFGYYAAANSFAGDIAGVDFATPTNKSATFSIQAWVNGSTGTQINGAGIVAKGYGGGEQFDLDLYGNAYRFFVRDASGAVHGPTSTLKPDGNWHFLMGVCDEVNSNVSLYVDGTLTGSSTVAPGTGILESPLPISIGARMSGTNTAYSYQFVGNMNDVAVYNYAFSAAQVRNLYYAQGIPATVVTQPTNTTCGQYGTATFTATINGTATVGSQWFDYSGPLPGQTNTTLVLTDVPSSDNSDGFYLQVTNAYGTNVSQTVYVSVIAGAPEITVNPTAQLFAPVGGTASFSVTAYGDEPLTYIWQASDTNAVVWTNLVNNGRIAGAQSNVLTIANVQQTDAGSYQVIVSNASGPVTSTIATLTVGTLPISFNGNGLGWTGKQSGSFATTPLPFNNGMLTLTDGNNSEARSEFFTQPQYVGAFEASFTYQYAPGSTTVPADGIAFVLQNDPRGASAAGAGGGDLGVGGAITPSVELELNVYPSAAGGNGYSVNTNGAIGPNKQMGALVLTTGDPINVTVSYFKGQPLSLTFTDAVAGTSFRTNINLGNLTNLVGGSTAYVGFTGGTGGDNSVQSISNFSFTSLALQAMQLTATNTVVISWPGTIEGYVLQQNSNLTTTNWVNVTNPVNAVGGQNQVILPLNSSNAFYRLNLAP